MAHFHSSFLDRSILLPQTMSGLATAPEGFPDALPRRGDGAGRWAQPGGGRLGMLSL